MPSAVFGKKINNVDKTNLFVSLTKKGESITARIVKSGVYDGKHFQQNDDKSWKITYCPRIMEGLDCDLCQQMFEIKREIKSLKEKKPKNYESKIETYSKEARAFTPKVTFYYPIINRETGEAQLFKTTLSVRLKLEEYFAQGFDLLKGDFIISRTEQSPANFYSVLRKDSADVKPFTEDEKKAFEKANAWDLEEMIKSKPSNQEMEAPLPDDPNK
jgi:hypothetical protein